MKADEVKTLLGNMPEHISDDFDNLVNAANADPGEGVEWLPRYKLALSLLANAVGLASGALTKLATVFDRQPAGTTIRRIHSEIGDLWEAHLRCVSEQIAPPATPPTIPREVADRLAEAIEKACDIANNRWSEWGGRAERVEEEIQNALAEYRKAVSDARSINSQTLS